MMMSNPRKIGRNFYFSPRLVFNSAPSIFKRLIFIVVKWFHKGSFARGQLTIGRNCSRFHSSCGGGQREAKVGKRWEGKILGKWQKKKKLPSSERWRFTQIDVSQKRILTAYLTNRWIIPIMTSVLLFEFRLYGLKYAYLVINFYLVRRKTKERNRIVRFSMKSHVRR